MDKDVTKEVKFGNIDEEFLELCQCVCGHEEGDWDDVLSIYRDSAYQCPQCGRKLYFQNKITVYEVVEKEKK